MERAVWYPMKSPDPRVGVVIASRNRSKSLLRSLAELARVPERPRIIVVDNGSNGGTPEEIARLWPAVELIALEENLGAAARTVGAAALDTPYVAFSDSDSWWAPGALSRAADCFDLHPDLAVVAARILVGDSGDVDPTCTAMARSPLPARRDLPGPAVLGFVACGSVVRRTAFLDVGGFEPRFGVGAEEELLAIDLAAAGWDLAYVDTVVAHHHPLPDSERDGRRRALVRNALWTAWLRRPPARALNKTLVALRGAARDRHVAAALAEAVIGWRWIAANRRTVPPDLEALLRLVDEPAA
jgi:GT2 family glycosyltransferase